MLKGFKEFIMRGNVVELAIAVVIGTAFQAVVSSFTSAIITPILNSVPGASSSGLGFSLRHGDKFVGKDGTNTTFINISTIINAIIVFLITAAVVYFIFVVPMNKFQERRAAKTAKGEPDPTPKPEDVILLEQIRDLLQAQASGSGPSPSPSPSPSPKSV